MTTSSTQALLSAVESIPRDEDGPVFSAPWEAEIFAIVHQLHERGVFTWSEWAEALGVQIKLAQEGGDPDLGDTYYLHWLSTVEQLLENREIAQHGQLAELYTRWEHAAMSTPHGQPIVLKD